MPLVQAGEVELYYEEHGRGEPLLCIMGFATDSTGWVLQVPELASRYRTIVFDNRGIGRSAKPAGPYTIHQMADDAAQLLEALEVPRAHVLASSMGGMIAQELALRHPQRVTSLVLASTFPEPDEEVERTRQFTLKELGGTLSVSGEVQIDLTTLDPLRFFQHLLPMVFSPTFIAEELPKLMDLFSATLQHGFSVETVFAQLQAVMAHRATDRLHRISVPTLVLTGDADRLIAPRNSEILAGKIPGAALVVIPGGSHGVNLERPAEFNRIVLEFLASLPARSGSTTPA